MKKTEYRIQDRIKKIRITFNFVPFNPVPYTVIYGNTGMESRPAVSSRPDMMFMF